MGKLSPALAFVILALGLALAVSQLVGWRNEDTARFETLCQVQDRFLDDVISVRQDTANSPDTSEGEKRVARNAVQSYTETRQLLHDELGKDCEL